MGTFVEDADLWNQDVVEQDMITAYIEHYACMPRIDTVLQYIAPTGNIEARSSSGWSDDGSDDEMSDNSLPLEIPDSRRAFGQPRHINFGPTPLPVN